MFVSPQVADAQVMADAIVEQADQASEDWSQRVAAVSTRATMDEIENRFEWLVRRTVSAERKIHEALTGEEVDLHVLWLDLTERNSSLWRYADNMADRLSIRLDPLLRDSDNGIFTTVEEAREWARDRTEPKLRELMDMYMRVVR